MNTRLLASLEDALEEWSNRQCEGDNWPPSIVSFYPDQIKHMALAASIIFDANEQVSGKKK